MTTKKVTSQNKMTSTDLHGIQMRMTSKSKLIVVFCCFCSCSLCRGHDNLFKIGEEPFVRHGKGSLIDVLKIKMIR